MHLCVCTSVAAVLPDVFFSRVLKRDTITPRACSKVLVLEILPWLAASPPPGEPQHGASQGLDSRCQCSGRAGPPEAGSIKRLLRCQAHVDRARPVSVCLTRATARTCEGTRPLATEWRPKEVTRRHMITEERPKQMVGPSTLVSARPLCGSNHQCRQRCGFQCADKRSHLFSARTRPSRN